MILYRYLASHWIDTLRNGRLKVSRPQEFNDPYDCLGVCVGRYPISTVKAHLLNKGSSVYATTIATAKELSISIEDAADVLGRVNVRVMSDKMANVIANRNTVNGVQFILCFSGAQENDSSHSLMWAHYANKCNGVRLGFDFGGPEFEMYVNAVRYSCERATLNLAFIKDFEHDHEYFRFNEDNFLMKSIEWAYEREYRMMIDDKHSEMGNDNNGNTIRFWRFKPEYLQTVDLGFGIHKEEENEIIDIVTKNYSHVKVRRLLMSKKGYSFALEPLNWVSTHEYTS